MSVNGLTQQYIPPTLDGLNVVEADQIYIDGELVNLDNLVPYTGATRTVDVGIFPIKTSYLAAANEDVVNKERLDLTVNNIVASIGANFLSKTNPADQTVASKVSFSSDLIVADERVVNLASKVVVDANYQNLITSASVSVGQNFGTITNALGVYQSTTDIASGIPILIAFPITSGKRYSFTIEMLIEDPTYTWYIDLYQSVDNINPVTGGVIGNFIFPQGSTSYTLSGHTFQALTTGNVIIPVSNDAPSPSNQAVKWKNLTVYEEGVALTNVSMPAQLADRVVVLNEKKQLVSSGINTTKLGYLDNVSSDIQTQLISKASTTYVDTQDGLRVLKSGDTMSGTLNMGTNKITTSYVPVNGVDLTNKTYVDGAITGAGALYVLKAGDTMTGNLTLSGVGTTAGVLAKRYYLSARGDNQDDVAGDEKYGPWYGLGDSGITGFIGKPCLTGFYGCALRSGLGYMVVAENGNVGIGTTDPKTQLTVARDIAFADRVSNPFKAQTTIKSLTNGQRLYLGAYYTGGEGSCSAIQSSDFYSELDHGADLNLNPLGGTVNISKAGSSINVLGNLYAPYLSVTGDTQLRNSFIAPDYYLNCGNGNNSNDPSPRTQIAFGWHGDSTGYRHRITSTHNSGDGVSGNGNSLNFYLWSNANNIGDFGSNHRMTLAGGGVGIYTTTPTEPLTVNGNGLFYGTLRTYANGLGGPSAIYSENASAGNAYAVMFLKNNALGGCYWFLNSSSRTDDGGSNTATLRNDIGSLRLQSAGANGIFIQSGTGNLGIGGEADLNGKINLRNPNGSYTHIGYSDNHNYIRGVNTYIDTETYLNGAPFVGNWRSITWRVGRDELAPSRCLWTPLAFLRLYETGSGANAYENWNGRQVFNVMNLPTTCNILVQGFLTYFADAGGRRFAYARLYHPATNTYYYPEATKFFNIGSNHEVVPINTILYGMPAGSYDLLFFVGGNVYVDVNDRAMLSVVVFT